MTIRAIENAPEYKKEDTREIVKSLKAGVNSLGLELKYDDNLGDLEFMSGLPHLAVVFFEEQKRIGGLIRKRKIIRVGNVFLSLNKAQLPVEGGKLFDDVKIVGLALLMLKHNLSIEYI